MQAGERLRIDCGRGVFVALALLSNLIALILIIIAIIVANALNANARTQISKPVTFAHDVAPIVYQHCASCHHPDGPAPFSLLKYEDVKKYAAPIAAATRTRSMPPWLPEVGYGDFADESRLTDAQIQMISNWVREGAPEGPASDLPQPPSFSGPWQMGPPDLILKAAQPHLVPASGPEVFWNFIFSPQVKTRRYVRAIEILPGDANQVHHANLLVDPLQSARREEIAPGAGFAGMDVEIERSPDDYDSHFLFWKPGTKPWVEPDGLAWQLDPGEDLVLNAHLKPTGKPAEVAPSIGLYFTDKPPTQFPIVMELEDDPALNIPPGDPDFIVRDDFRLPADVDVLAIYPHAHYLGRLLEAYATLPNGQHKWLIRIPHWDPNWQGVYHYREPVSLPKGTVISMRYHYDNSAANPRNPNSPPHQVLCGNNSTDEMAHLWLQVLPRGSGDAHLAIEEALARHRLEKDPNDFDASLWLGALLLREFNPGGAVAELQRAVRIAPQRAEGHNWLGMALVAVGRSSEATEQFRAALRIRSDYPNARYNLARALVKAGKLDEARNEYSELIAATPDDAQVRNDFGELLLRLGKPAEALQQFDKALALDPSQQTTRKNRDLALQQSK
jgi:Tfp pilus assembly protein PilF